MSWFLNRIRERREQHHLRKVRRLQKKQLDRIQVIEERYEDLNFFAAPESDDESKETGMIPDAREKYALYLLHRVGIYFIPEEALLLARKFGPALAAERVCLWLGLDYHKIAAVAPRIASETARATRYFDEMKHSCDLTGIDADPLLPHIHFGSHDTRDILFESFRTSARIIELYDGMNEALKAHVDWDRIRPVFIKDWKDITTECLMQFYNQGILLSEYQKNIELGTRILHICSQQDPDLIDTWLSYEGMAMWQNKFPSFDVMIILVHLSNRIREIDRRRSMELNRTLKKIHDSNFDFQLRGNHALHEDPETAPEKQDPLIPIPAVEYATGS